MSSSFIVAQHYDIHQDALRRIDEEISQLEARLTSLHLAFPHISDSQSLGQITRDEINQLEVKIRSLKSTRNSLIPIARLHHEILQEIFIISSEEAGEQAALLMSWISRSWREIALQTPALWSYLTFKHPDWAQAALSRTRDHELGFCYIFPFEELKAYKHLIPIWHDTLHRMRRIYLTPFSMRPPMEKFPIRLNWVTPAPCLVEVHLHRISLPENLFSGSCPSLRSLYLTGCEVAWNAIPVSPRMTELTIKNPSPRVSIHDVITKMRIIGPTLRVLALESILLPTTGPPKPSQPRIQFDHMSSFTLEDENAQSVCCFLDQASLPGCPKVDVEVSGGTLEDQFATTQAVVGARGVPRWPVTHLEVGLHEEYLSFHMTEEEIRSAEDTLICDKKSIKLSLSTVGFNHAAAVLPAFGSLPFSPVNTLRFSGGWSDPQGPLLLDHFNSQRTVQFLELAVEFVPTFLQFIKPQNDRLHEIVNAAGVSDYRLHEVVQTVGFSDGNVLLLGEETKKLGSDIIEFRALRRITIEGDEFDDTELLYASYMALREWLIWRNVFGVRLGSLVLKDMKVPNGTMGWFKDLVDEL
ncbi:hypothetical protein BDN72DRAFT_962497, partial [Pluteus cervinus]